MKTLFNILRILIALFLIFFLLRKVNLKMALQILRQSLPTFIILAGISFFFFLLISNIRWKILLDIKGLDFSSNYLLRIYFVSYFFNNILPTAIGGDVMRVTYTIKKDSGVGTPLSVVFIDRVIGFLGLFFFALLASLVLLFLKLPGGRNYLVINLIGFFVILGGIWAILAEAPYRLFRRLYLKLKFKGLGERIDRFATTLRNFSTNLRPLFLSFLLSLLVQLTIAGTWYFSGLAIKKNISPLYYFLYIPLIGLMTMIPITLGGLGVRENAFVYFFKGVGLSCEEALGISLLFLLINYLYSLIGGLIFLFIKRR